MTRLSQRMLPGFTYHIIPQIAKDKEAVLSHLEPIIRDGYWSGLQIPPIGNAAVVKELAAQLRLAGMTAVYGVGGTLSRAKVSLHTPDEENRKAAIDLSRELIDEAYLMGARIMDLNPGKDPGPAERSREKDLLVDSLSRLCGYAAETAKDYVLGLSMEHFDREVDKKYLLGPTSETIEVIRRIQQKHDNMGITADISHLFLLGEDPAQSVRDAGDLVFHAHLSNYIVKDKKDPRWGDNHPPHWVPLSEVGPGEIAPFLQALWEIGYFDIPGKPYRHRLVTFEIRPGDGEPPETVIAGSRRVLDQAVALVQ